MCQYFRVIFKEGNKNIEIFNRKIIIDGQEEYMIGKLMEHSWWHNPFVCAVAEKIYKAKSPVRLIWMGDYANDNSETYPEGFNGVSAEKIEELYYKAWGKDVKGKAIKASDFTLDGKYIVNHTKKEYIDCSEYFKVSVRKSKWHGDWCIHPLPILVCIGNGLGFGDFIYPTLTSTESLIGAWIWDKISITDNEPDGYEEIFPLFKQIYSEDDK